MGYFWCFFKFEDTELEKQFWDSNSQRSRRWWLGACAFFLSYALIKVVRLHNRGDPITNYAPLISTCATYFLLIALNILPHRWHQHVVYVRTISVIVLGACLFWFLQVDMSYQISDANTMAIASSPVCSDAEVARMHDEVVRMLRERLEVEIVRHHVTLAWMLGSCYLTVTCVTFDWCKTVFLAVVSFLSTAIVWQVCNPFVPVSKHANKIGAAVGLLFSSPLH